ncbi:MAG: hypothetical protein ABIV47_03380 [Roseiflexaceae bacterium]
MPSVQGYRLNKQVVKQQRPLGLAMLAMIGMLGSLLALMIALVQLLALLNVRPNLQLAMVAGVLVLALVYLWINWGFWELIRWAWWANMLLTLAAIGGLVMGLRWAQPLGAALAKLRPAMTEGQVLAAVMGGLLALLVYQLIVVLYMLSARAIFGVGVKDERPIWERANRRQQR